MSPNRLCWSPTSELEDEEEVVVEEEVILVVSVLESSRDAVD